MSKQIVAIIGRPNVGKSTLFNKMVGKRHAVIEDVPGITRDRLYEEARWEDKVFDVVDTGGFLHDPKEEFAKEVIKQILIAVEEADIILMMMDAESGVLPLDIELIDRLRKYGKRVMYGVNKIDGPKKEKTLLTDFYSIGVDLYPFSALNGYGYEHLMDSLTGEMTAHEEEKSEYPRIAIVGRPNVGKSTLVNALLSKERMIVSATPGTTRDAVDSVCSYYKKKYTLVDTAGIRRKGKMAKTVERYSFLRTIRNIENCDVALIVLDASEGIVELDQKIAGFVTAAKKGAIMILNKWDLVSKDTATADDLKKIVYDRLWFMKHVPVLTISALNKKRATKIFPIIDTVLEECSKRISTNELNLFLRNAVSAKEPPLYRGKKVKIYYISQVKTSPPGFIIFTNRKEGIKPQYIKYLEHKLRDRFTFEGAPVDFYIRQRKQKQGMHA
ncbi:MAG: ribosome biogenesis GTPase Der [Nitrospiraceae bacterium]|nr:MAG: ribosome biogenesis GTPase Der [Nitrospiraceae bacterium]